MLHRAQLVELHGTYHRDKMLQGFDVPLNEQHKTLRLQHVAATSPYVMNLCVQEAYGLLLFIPSVMQSDRLRIRLV